LGNNYDFLLKHNIKIKIPNESPTKSLEPQVGFGRARPSPPFLHKKGACAPLLRSQPHALPTIASTKRQKVAALLGNTSKSWRNPCAVKIGRASPAGSLWSGPRCACAAHCADSFTVRFSSTPVPFFLNIPWPMPSIRTQEVELRPILSMRCCSDCQSLRRQFVALPRLLVPQSPMKHTARRPWNLSPTILVHLCKRFKALKAPSITAAPRTKQRRLPISQPP
jgi:hypothetical protein